MRALLVALLVTIAGCGSSGGYEIVTFWQELGDRPGRAADPYSSNPDCELLDEAPRLILDDPEDISSGTLWVKRRYLCAAGAI